MSVVPKKRIDRVQFYEDHIEPLTSNSVALSLTTAEVTDLKTKTATARAAYDDQQVAQQKARAATETFVNAVGVMSAAGAAILKKVRAKAEQTGDPNVYTLAEIPAPATPAPRPAPGKPVGLKVALDDNGALQLSWKCPNPSGASGTIYQLYRAVGASEDFAYLGGVGSRKFVDATVPAGATRLTYQIQAVRSTAVGPWAKFVVSFGGSGSNGASVATLSATGGPKIAA